jgi:hypothetical protein
MGRHYFDELCGPKQSQETDKLIKRQKRRDLLFSLLSLSSEEDRQTAKSQQPSESSKCKLQGAARTTK